MGRDEGEVTDRPPSRRPPRPFFIIAGLVTESTQGQVVVEARATCTAHPDCGGKCGRIHRMLERSFDSRRGDGPLPDECLDLSTCVLWAAPTGPIVVAQREYSALMALHRIPVLQEVLTPSHLKGTTSGSWPLDCSSGAFHAHLHAQFDGPQIAAIEDASGYFGFTMPGAVSEGVPPRAFKLIQGPPGTGKTHTVCGMLNVWHLVQYQRHYKSLEALLTSRAAADRLLISVPPHDRQLMGQPLIGGDAQAALVEAIHKVMEEARGAGGQGWTTGSGDALPPLQPKPKILVAAPSNAATDELLGRIMSDGFTDLEGVRYFPHCLRVGSTEANLDARARLVLVETMLDEWLGMDVGTFEFRMLDVQTRLASACDDFVQHLVAVQDGSARRSVGKELVKLYGDIERGWADLQRLVMIRASRHLQVHIPTWGFHPHT